MASAIEKLLTEQETTSSQVALFNENNSTFEDLLLEQMITNEEISKFTAGLPASINTLKGLLDTDEVQAVEIMNVDDLLPSVVENQALVPEVLPAKEPDFLNKFFALKEEVDADRAEMIASNEELLESNKEALAKFNSSVSGAMTKLVGKLPMIGSKVEDALTKKLVDFDTDYEDIPDTPRELDFYAEIEDINEKSLFALMASEQHLGELVRIQKESNDVVGSASTVGGDEKPEDDSEGFDGFGGLFKRLGKKLGKFGKLAKGALKIGGAVLTAGFILSDVFEGFTSDEKIQEISGKAKSDLSDAEASAVAVANVIEGLSFGLINAKDTFPDLVPIVETMQDGIDQLFDPEIGLLGTLTSGFMNGIGQLMDGDIMAGMGTILKGFWELPKRVYDVVGGWVSNLVEMLPTAMSDSIKEKFGDAKEFIGGVFDSASSFLGFGDDEIDKLNKTGRTQPSNSALGFTSNNKKQIPSRLENKPAYLIPAGQKNESSTRAVSGLGNEGRRTMALSKQRFEERNRIEKGKGEDTTIVVNQQQASSRSMVRNKQNPDMTLAFLNSGFADG